MTLRPSSRRARPRWLGLITVVVLGLGLVGGAALAVHDDEFQLDGNTVVDPSPPDTIGDPPVPNPLANTDFDWESLFTDPDIDETGDPTPAQPGSGDENFPVPVANLPAGLADVEFVEDWSLVAGVYQTSDPTTFTQSKDIDQISSGWRCKSANQVTNKGDITNAYAAVYDNGTKRILYFGMEKDQDSGSNNVGLWLLQGQIACAGGGSGNGNAFTGNHIPGDIFLVSEFTNGGGVSTIKAYEWVPDVNLQKNGDQPGLNPTPFAASADCVVSPTTPGFDDRLCATSNRTNIEPAWTSWSFENGVNNEMRPATFVEGGIDLQGFTQFQNKCFSRFLFNTRSSQELTATLYDYALGNINTCNANVSIQASAVNEVGNQHVFTITANAIGGGTPSSIGIVPSVSPTPTSQSTTCAGAGLTYSNGGKTATCTFTINSTSAGTFTANATATFNYADSAPLVRSTSGDSGPGGSGPATKRFVDAAISIAADDTNAVGDPHTFTITFTALPSGATPVVFGAITPTLSGGTPDITNTNTCATPTVVNATTRSCTYTVNSTTVATFTLNASAQVTMGGVAVTRDTDPATATIGSGPDGSGPAVKRYVDASVTIAASDTNSIGEPHTFTITVTAIPGTASPIVFGAITPSVSPTPSPTNTNTCATPTVVNATTRTCSVTINSSTAGTFTANATAVVTIGGVQLTRDTDPATGTIGSGPGGSGPAVKTYVDGSVVWHKVDGNDEPLGGATFRLCRTETLDSSDGTYDADNPAVCIEVEDDVSDQDAITTLDEDPLPGEFLVTGLILGTYTVEETEAPAGYHMVTTGPVTVGSMTIAVRDLELEDPFVNERAFRIIVLTCDDITEQLVESTVTLDPDGPGGPLDPIVLDTITDVPGVFPAGTTESDLCTFGGAQFEDLDEGTYSLSVTVPKAMPI